MIVEILEDLEKVLRGSHKAIFETLAPAATDEQIFKLKEKCLSGNDVPQDLVSLYKWHNGQSESGSLNPTDNRTFLPIEELIDAWEFLNDPIEDILEPISKSWLPFTYNGAGDYLMLETEGDSEGSVITYWHDNVDRIAKWASLSEWAEDVLIAARS